MLEASFWPGVLHFLSPISCTCVAVRQTAVEGTSVSIEHEEKTLTALGNQQYDDVWKIDLLGEEAEERPKQSSVVCSVIQVYPQWCVTVSRGHGFSLSTGISAAVAGKYILNTMRA